MFCQTEKKLPTILILKYKQENSAIHGHSQIQSKSQLSLDYVKPCLNNSRNDNNVFRDWIVDIDYYKNNFICINVVIDVPVIYLIKYSDFISTDKIVLSKLSSLLQKIQYKFYIFTFGWTTSESKTNLCWRFCVLYSKENKGILIYRFFSFLKFVFLEFELQNVGFKFTYTE